MALTNKVLSLVDAFPQTSVPFAISFSAQSSSAGVVARMFKASAVWETLQEVKDSWMLGACVAAI